MSIIAAVWAALNEVKDPEIPVVSLVEMGIIREVEILPQNGVKVTITPTFSGCPALHVMKEDIVTKVRETTGREAQIVIVLHPPWSTDMIQESARDKLKTFGIVPPPVHGGSFAVTLLDVVKCPYCDSERTTLKNSFGPTLCRMIYYCNNCQQPFEQFKPL